MDTQELNVNGTEADDCGEKIHLYVDPKGGANSTMVAVRWCICKSVFDKIKESRRADPHILLVVTRDRVEVERKLVPLEQEMEYFYFQSSGEHKILATVMCGTARALKHDFLRKNAGGYYDNSIVDYETGKIRKDLEEYFGRTQFGTGEMSVNVAKEFFAKKPAEWVWNWVNFWYETKPRDQCQYRKRCWLAFSVQPPVILVWALFICSFRFLAAVFHRFGFGTKGIKFSPVLHPLKMDTNDVWWDAKVNDWPSVFDDVDLPAFMLLVVMPFSPFCYFVVLAGLKLCLLPAWSMWWVPVATLAVMAIITAIGFGVLLLGATCRSIADKASEKEKSFWRSWRTQIEFRAKLREAKRAKVFLQQYDQTYSPMICQGEPLEAKLEALPPTRRTFHLRFMDLKTKVCKPFSKY